MNALLMLLALCATAPGEPKAERWEPMKHLPGWEMFGKKNASGQFIYSQTRFKKALPAKNYGVNLSTPPAYGHSLNGPPSDVVRDLASSLDSPVSSGASASSTVADCDDGRCPPNRKPDQVPEVKPWHGLSPGEAKIAIIAVGGSVFLVVCVVMVFIVFAIARYAFRTFFSE